MLNVRGPTALQRQRGTAHLERDCDSLCGCKLVAEGSGTVDLPGLGCESYQLLSVSKPDSSSSFHHRRPGGVRLRMDYQDMSLRGGCAGETRQLNGGDGANLDDQGDHGDEAVKTATNERRRSVRV